ncbi:AraC family ligand binding domain-containing protein [Paenibacillus rhizoplanae]
MYIFVDDRVVTVHKGELILIPSRELHSTASSEKAEFERILINYDPLLLPPALRDEQQWFQNHRYRLFRLTLREQNEAESLLNRMQEESRIRRPFYEACVTALLTELMILLQRSESTAQAGGTRHPLHHLVTEVATYIRAHYREALTLEETAKDFFSSAPPI